MDVALDCIKTVVLSSTNAAVVNDLHDVQIKYLLTLAIKRMHSLKKENIILSLLVFMPREPYQCNSFQTSNTELKTERFQRT